jgi:glutaredoxin-like protein
MRSLEHKFAVQMVDEVTLIVFVDESIAVTHELVDLANTMAKASPKIKVEIEKVVEGKNQRMKDMKIENWPALVLKKGDFTRIRYYGIPSGLELLPLVDAIAELSSMKTGLSPKGKELLSKVRRRANIKIFVLTTCHFCPIVARHAYRAAIESPNVTAEIIDSSVFLDLAVRHTVMGVPKIILNDNTDITGAVDEIPFLEKLRDADHALLDSIYG